MWSGLRVRREGKNPNPPVLPSFASVVSTFINESHGIQIYPSSRLQPDLHYLGKIRRPRPCQRHVGPWEAVQVPSLHIRTASTLEAGSRPDGWQKPGAGVAI